jgi:signal transduction histidine kinase
VVQRPDFRGFHRPLLRDYLVVGGRSLGHHYSQVWHQVWETMVRMIYFLLFVVGGTSVKNRIELLEYSRNLELEIIRTSEREQQRIGRDLHDGLCQYFAAIGCAAGSLKRNLAKQGVPLTSRAGEIEELIMQGVTQTRNLARGLFPVEDDEAGLQSALHELASNSSQLLELQCAFECESPVRVFDNVSATHLYRIAQESISNATDTARLGRPSSGFPPALRKSRSR